MTPFGRLIRLSALISHRSNKPIGMTNRKAKALLKKILKGADQELEARVRLLRGELADSEAEVIRLSDERKDLLYQNAKLENVLATVAERAQVLGKKLIDAESANRQWSERGQEQAAELEIAKSEARKFLAACQQWQTAALDTQDEVEEVWQSVLYWRLGTLMFGALAMTLAMIIWLRG